jgi:alpha-tubulin suppressor-like RCC1 family protein
MKVTMKIFVAFLLGAATVIPWSLSDVQASDTSSLPGFASTPVLTSVSAGTAHTCIVRDAVVWCTGLNSSGQLGNGTTVRSLQFVPSLVDNATQVSAHGNTTCAVKRDFTLWCWGLLATGLDPLLPAPTLQYTPVTTPLQMPLDNVRTVAIGQRHSCAIRTDATVWCWGKNTAGQLGNGSTDLGLVPVRARISQVQSLDVGTDFTCAVRTTTSVWCWGSNRYQRLGLKGSRARRVPTFVPVVRATEVATGSAFTCIIATNNRVQCWGRNQYGQLARTTGPSRRTPHTTSIKRPVMLTAGDEFACAVTAAGTSWCWGRNRFSQLANNSNIRNSRPQKVFTPDAVGPITRIGTGQNHACGLATKNAAMWCWGLALQGQLGDGGGDRRGFGTAIWPNGVRMKPIGTNESARVVATGDISCDDGERLRLTVGPSGQQCGDVFTAALTATLAPDAVLALGDTQNDRLASIDVYRANYALSWGSLLPITYPIRGNHEYLTPGAAGYVEYFAHMSPAYWSADMGGWRVIAVDSWCQGLIFAGCSATSPQTLWLTAELAAARTEGRCALVLMHHPLVSSGRHATSSVQHLWKAAVDGGADLVLTGHDHIYERFSPLDNKGAPTTDGTGTPLIIAGLGGARATPIVSQQPGSQFVFNADHGVLSMTFTPTTYSWGFVSAVDNSISDSGSANCVP